MPVPVQIGGLLEPGLRAEAAFVYRQNYQPILATLGEVMWMDLTSDKFKEIYGYLETAPFFTWWPATGIIPSSDVGSQRFEIVNRDFGVRVYLPRNAEDDQTGTAYAKAREIAVNYAFLPHEIFYQVIQAQSYNGTTRPLPVLPLWADGSAMFTSSTRYGSSSGNTVTLTSASTVQGIITDLNSVTRRFQDFQNTKSREFFNPEQTKTMTIFHGTAQTQVMNQAEFQVRTPWEATSATTGQTPTNLLMDAKFNLKFVPSQRITATAYYCFLRNLEAPLRPLYRQVRKGYTEWQGNFVSSDYARDTGQVYVQGDCREGYGAPLAIGAIKVV